MHTSPTRDDRDRRPQHHIPLVHRSWRHDRQEAPEQPQAPLSADEFWAKLGL